MDSITEAIRQAIQAGLHIGGPKLLEKTAGEAYEFLKGQLRKKLGDGHEVQKAVTELEKQPESAGRTAVLSEEIAKTGAPRDPELNAAARALIEALRSVQPRSSNTLMAQGNYNALASDHSTASVTVTGASHSTKSKS